MARPSGTAWTSADEVRIVEVGLNECPRERTSILILRMGLETDQQPRGLGGLSPSAPVNDLAQVGVHEAERVSPPGTAPLERDLPEAESRIGR